MKNKPGCKDHPPGGWELVRLLGGRICSEGRTYNRSTAVKHCYQRSSQYVRVDGELYSPLPLLNQDGTLGPSAWIYQEGKQP
jgi:hypothetical protein